MFLLGLVAPIYSPYAVAQIGLLQAHLIGILQGLVFFAFAWMWPHLSLPEFSKKLATFSLYLSLWTNWIGTFMVGVFGGGREQYIVNQDLVPGATGFWNVATVLLISLSQFALLTVILAIVGFLNVSWTNNKNKLSNTLSLIMFLAILALSLFQTAFPEYSNG
jgi:hydroxylaminobenzene mutase